MELLDMLFGGAAKVKILKLFIMNPNAVFSMAEASKRAKLSKAALTSELRKLKVLGFVKEKSTLEGKRKVKGWQLNDTFPLLHPLGALLATDQAVSKGRLLKRFSGVGKLKLVLIAGAFLHRNDSRADLLIVGDSLKPSKIDTAIRTLEADMGKELSYAVCDTENFFYRLYARDRFIRDILDYPHEVLFDRIGAEKLV
jgi:hypothetical protein